MVFIGIDNGGTATKAGVFDDRGRELAVAGRKAKIVSPQPGWRERDPEATWENTCAAIREAIQASGIDPAEIAGVAAAGYGNGLHLVDAEGRPARPAIESSDGRAAAYAERWVAEGVWDRVLPKTTQTIWPAQPTALLAWVRDHEPEVMARARWILMAKDYIRMRLTGEICAEITDMSGTGLMDVPAGQYDDSILEAFGLEDMSAMLPPLVRTEEICGAVTAEAAEATGIPQGVPVVGGMFDIDACGLASGLVDERWMSLVSGTWGNNQYIAPEPLVSKGIYMTSRYAMPGFYLMLEGSPTSAGNLEWFIQEFFAAEAKAAAERDESVYDVCNRLVAGTNPEDGDITFFPFLYGSNMDAGARSALIGVRGEHTRGHVLRAVYEGVVFSHRTHLERLLKFRDRPERMLFTGGAAQSPIWTKIFADAFQIPFEIPEGRELGALGAAIAAAVGVGCYGDFREAVGAMTRPGRVQEPDPDQKEIYDHKYARYHQLYEALAPIWNRPNVMAS